LNGHTLRFASRRSATLAGPYADPPANTRPRRKRNDQLASRPRVLGERVTDPDDVREGVARALDLLLQVDSQLHDCRVADPWPSAAAKSE
jgi:hypothetical protein